MWCEMGYPRKDLTLGADYARCACFTDMAWDEKRALYPGCDPGERLCKT